MSIPINTIVVKGERIGGDFGIPDQGTEVDAARAESGSADHQ